MKITKIKVDWDLRFLNLAKHKAQWSKDPDVKVGAVIAFRKQDKYYGYNGFPPGINDTNERLYNKEMKNKLMIHAEMNAILTTKEELTNHTIYCTRPSCIRCAVIIIRAGIARVVCYDYLPHKRDRHSEEQKLVKELYDEAGVDYEIIRDRSSIIDLHPSLLV